jgi:Helicase HerA, central domain
MADGFYLGKTVDPKTQALGEEFRLTASDLTTHGIVIGMTGSGKTGLSIVLIEEALKAGTPVIVIDPKGDMTNLALAFGTLQPPEFRPWVDVNAAALAGESADAAAEAAAATWSKGLAEWGISAADVASYAASRDVQIITPGSTSGTPLNLIESLEPPAAEVMADEEELRDQIDAVVTALLGLIGIKADPIESREYILLATLVDRAWRGGQALSLEALIGQVAAPPIEKIGALPLDVVYPPVDRNKLMLALNNLLASPLMAAWRQGDAANVDAWLRAPDGRPRATIIYTAHLEEEQRVFVTALILNKIVSWVRRQPGSGELRALLYMDEIFGYFPPTANPPTKKPLLTLLKQARAYGLGVLLSTQNPVDLDYRGLANMGLWAIGRLQTTQDQARIRSGIEAALADSALAADFDSLISGVQKRVFLIHDIHRKQPELVHSRFAMSYLRGPMTREEIERLTVGAPAATVAAAPSTASTPAAATPVAAPAPTAGAPAPQVAPVVTPPPLPAPLRARFLNLRGGNVAQPHLYVKAAVRYKVGRSSTPETTHSLGFPIDPGVSAVETLAATPLEIDESQISDAAPGNVSFGDLPAYLSIDGPKAIERALRERLDDCFQLDLQYDPVTKTVSEPGESVEAFTMRVQNAPAVQANRKKLESKLEAKRGMAQDKKSEVSARGMEKWASLGTSILSNIGLLSGRKRTVTGVGGVLSKQRMESNARNRVERLEAEVAELEQQLAEVSEVDATRFETRSVKPAKTDVAVIRYDILWVT